MMYVDAQIYVILLNNIARLRFSCASAGYDDVYDPQVPRHQPPGRVPNVDARHVPNQHVIYILYKHVCVSIHIQHMCVCVYI